MKHTPGPWKVVVGVLEHASLIHAGDYAREGEPDLIVEVCSANHRDDARLIAAGPELLEALKSVAAAYGWESEDAVRSPISKAVIRAIAKAEGNHS